jgi:hypothetical protein
MFAVFLYHKPASAVIKEVASNNIKGFPKAAVNLMKKLQ